MAVSHLRAENISIYAFVREPALKRFSSWLLKDARLRDVRPRLKSGASTQRTNAASFNTRPLVHLASHPTSRDANQFLLPP